MTLEIDISLNERLSLPLAHHHIVQAALYALIQSDERTAQIHEQASKYEKRDYKLFTFGKIKGSYEVEGKIISFREKISLEVRAFHQEVIEVMEESIQRNGINLAGNIYTNVRTQVKDEHIHSDSVIIHMESPICVRSTDAKTGHTTYYSPSNPDFYQMVKCNFAHKYEAATGEKADEDIDLKKIDVRAQDKYVTRYKNFIIEAYRGTYCLQGKPEYLDFLYQTGLGEKNSQGFGMFRVVD